MALDPNIVLQLGHGVTPIENPMDVAAKGLSLQQAMRQGQMQDMQMQQTMAQQQRESEFRQALAGAQDDSQVKSAFMAKGDPKGYHEYQTAQLQQEKTLRDAQKARIEALVAFNQRQASILSTVKDPASWDAAQQQMASEAQKIGIDTSKSDHPAVYDPKWVADKIQSAQTMDEQLKNKWKELDAQHANATLEETKRHNQVMEKKPNAAQVMMMGNNKPSMGDPNDALAKLSPNDRAIVEQLASRKLMVGRSGGFTLNNPANKALYALAVQLNPSLSVVDDGAYKIFVDDLAKSSPTSAGGRVDAGNRMLGHAGDLIDALEKLKPGSGVIGKIGNVISYPGEKTFGNTMGTVSFIKSKLLGEVNKLVTGGVPHAEEMKHDIENMPDTATKEQWANLIKAIADVGLEQVTATEEKRNNFLGSLAPKTSMLSSKAQSNLSKIYKYAGAEVPQLQNPSGSGYTVPAIQGAGDTTTTTKPPTKINPADGKTYYLHSDNKYYSTKA